MSQDRQTCIELRRTLFEASWMHVLCAGWYSAFFMYLSYAPLWHTDLWGHVAYGHWMLDYGRLPAFDPFVELADVTPLIASAWIVLKCCLERWNAVEGQSGFSCVFAVVSVINYATLGLVFFRQTSRLSLALVGSILTWLICWDRHLVLRPELVGFGPVCDALSFAFRSFAYQVSTPTSDRHCLLRRRRFDSGAFAASWGLVPLSSGPTLMGRLLWALILLTTIAIGAVCRAWRRGL